METWIPPSNTQILNTHKEIFIQIEFILILDVWWFDNPAPVELRGPPRLGTPIPPSNPPILNTHKETFIQNDITLILDVWWFNNPAPVELRDPPHLGTPIPPSNPWILNTHKEIFIQIEFILILDVWWFESWYIPQALEIPIFAWRNTPTKRNEQNTVLVDFRVCAKT
jgi:hypothetical protein